MRSHLQWPLPLLTAALLLACSRGEPKVAPGSSDAPPPQSIEVGRDNPDVLDPALDALLSAAWSEASVSPAPRVDDATFLRRVTLDLTGRIPSRGQVRAFTSDQTPHKRRRIVDELIASEGYAEHWSEVYTELYLGSAARVRPFVRNQTQQWLQDQFTQNVGYDQIATDVIAASGDFAGPGPHGFVLTHGQSKNFEALTAEVSRVFLGVRLECAQCHDHPFDDRYSQRDFYEFTAFFAGTRGRVKKGGGKKRTVTLLDRPKARMRMPTATDAAGERTGPIVETAFLGRPVEAQPNSRREALASNLVESDLFAKAVVARTWERLCGTPIGTGWSDLGGEQDPKHPPLLDYLATQFIANDYDHAALLRAITLSTAYQRASWAPGRDEETARQATTVFAQSATRPMDADQLFRSLLIATGVQRVAGKRFNADVKRRKKRALAEYRLVFADDEMTTSDTFTGTVPQALLLLNGKLVQRGSTTKKGSTLARILKKHTQPARRIDEIYLATYGRLPTDAQRQRAVAFVADSPGSDDKAYEDLMHAMLLSSEFLTIH